MRLKVDVGNHVRNAQAPAKKSEVKNDSAPQPANQHGVHNKLYENNFQASKLKNDLNNRVSVQTVKTDSATTRLADTAKKSPSEALDQIKELPAPDLKDSASVRAYNEQRAAIADSAIQAAVPPSRDDFRGLPPRLAAMEFRDALASHNSDLSELRLINDAAETGLQNSFVPPSVDAAAQRVWDAANDNPQAGARVLAQEINNLNAQYGPEAGAELISKLQQDTRNRDVSGRNLYNILSFAGGEENGSLSSAGLSEAERNTIGTAVGQAYDKMSADDKADFVKNLVTATEANGTRGNAVGGDAARIADIVARGASPALKQDVVNALTERMTEVQPGLFGNNNGAEIKALANSAVLIASSAEADTQAQMFGQIVKTFPQMNEKQLNSLMNDPTFKDNISKLFLNNSTEIIKSLTDVNGRFPDTASIDGLKKFFEMTMFAKNPGELRDEVMAKSIELVSGLADPNAPALTGRDKESDAYLAGGLVSVIQSAANSQKDAILADQASRTETAKLFVGLAFSFAPGAGRVLGEGANKGLEYIYGKAVDFARTNTESALSDFINGLLDGNALEVSEDGFNVFRELATSVPSEVLGNHDDLADSFDQGYTKAGELLDESK